ncbi:asparagine synthase C-terminal domain-containing protein [Hyphococcus luteus]|uniref:asparagine synthase (glutamine-hydrolyzing) n=1 Tax=Hyphococcus luteus TaxID=2058213 RepID=A0A2S7K3V5_9PROT|nr:asparagine synthase C-terminal domain-containing protein [Marinicaulis flavus]PQA87177.1 hypothetical protein CW354_14150 [Marinicaulis flavus]
MYRYFAAVWDPLDETAASEARALERLFKISPARDWRHAWRADGVSVFDSGALPARTGTLLLPDNGGAVLGRLHRNDYSPVDGALCAHEARKLIASRGQALADGYWGRYAAFLRDNDGRAFHIVRDPTGAMPCFAAYCRQLRLFFSDMQDAADLDFLPFSVNWRYLAANFLTPQLQKTETGLNEVSEVLPGECWTFHPGGFSRRFIWDPFAVAEDVVATDVNTAADILKNTVVKTISALTRGHDSAAVALGGLDSSIALACLAKARPRPNLIALNYYTPSSLRGEERFYSRQTAQACDASHLEIELKPQSDLGRLSSSIRLASPPGMFDCIGLAANPSRIAADHGADVLFTGIGGDNVFCQPAFNFSALDYARRNGAGAGLFKAVLHASRYGRVSFAESLADTARELIRPAPCGAYVLERLYGSSAPAFVNRDFLADCDAKSMLHPLLAARDGDLKAKYLQILSCAFFAVDYYDHWDTGYSAERVHAFLQQPIIEACLRVPAWIMTHGGVDRALARMAFRDMLPGDVVRRFGKSTPAAYYEELCRNNLDFIRSALIDGALSEARIVDRKSLECALKPDAPFVARHAYDLLNLTGVEYWARGWSERRAHRNIMSAA